MKNISILQLLLMVVLSFQENCQQGEEKNYYIYNVTYYHCENNEMGHHFCKKYSMVRKDGDGSYILVQQKNSNTNCTIEEGLYTFTDVRCKQMTQNDNCRYTYEKIDHKAVLIWVNDYLDIGSQNGKKMYLCNVNICKIIFASKNNSSSKLYIPEKDYDETNNSEHGISNRNTTGIWYIYKFVLDFTVYYDSIDPYRIQATKFKLKKNLRTGDIHRCRNNINVCCSAFIFLNISNLCGYIQEWGTATDETYTEKITVSSKFQKYNLTKKETLCGEKVWFTSKFGFVASERKLGFILQSHFYKALIVENNSSLVQQKQIEYLKSVSFYLMILVILCVLLCVLSTVINFFSLRALDADRTFENKLYFLNCLCPSLTGRIFEFSNLKGRKVNEPTEASSEAANVIMENEIYNKF